jgi:hypothetical protein
MALTLDNIGLTTLFVPAYVPSASATLLTQPADIFVAQTALSEIQLTTLGFGHRGGSTSNAFISEVTFSDGDTIDLAGALPIFEFAFSTSVTFALQTDGQSLARSWASLTSYKPS